MLKNSRQGVDLEVAAGRVRGSEKSYRCIGKTKSCLLCGGGGEEGGLVRKENTSTCSGRIPIYQGNTQQVDK